MKIAWPAWSLRYVPELKVFVDDRCELYGEAFLLDYLDAMKERPEYWFNEWHKRTASTSP